MNMTSSRPYLIRALYEWIVENDCTPCLLVDATWPGACVPAQFAKDGQIVLNISPMAVRDLEMGNESVAFLARFNGEACHVCVPVAAVSAVYARENGQGTVFDPEQAEDEPPQEAAPTAVPKAVDMTLASGDGKDAKARKGAKEAKGVKVKEAKKAKSSKDDTPPDGKQKRKGATILKLVR